jgi:cysteine desulfurase family protein (TIGR01976 family)
MDHDQGGSPEVAMQFDLDTIRAQFPALTLQHDDGPRIYFDNPAGTQVPQIVLRRMTTTMVHCNANMHGNFRTSREATELSHQAHVAMADFYNAASDREVVFGPNMTTLTFMLTRVLGPRFQAGDELITTHMEHDGNNTPWRTMAAERGMVVKTLAFDRDTYEFDLDELDALITPRTRLAALNFSSNILGTINPIKEMVRRLKAVGALTYIDAVQYAPHGPIDVQDLGCDFLVSSAYKFYGPHQGVLWGREDLLQELPAYKLRVVADESLEGQAGTIGATEYLQWVGVTMGADHMPENATLRPRTREIHGALAAMAHYEHELSGRLIAGLQQIPGVEVRGITEPTAFDRRVPTVSLTAPGLVPAELASFLDTHGVYVWDGHSYALPVIEWLGLQDRGGVVRIGPTHYNTVGEVDTVLQLISDFFGRR